MIEFVIPGRPQPKERPRAMLPNAALLSIAQAVQRLCPQGPITEGRLKSIRAAAANRIHVFTPRTTSEYERLVGLLARRAMRAVGLDQPLSGPVQMTLDIVLGDLRRVDCSNIQKSVEDGMNGIVFEDDCQIFAPRPTRWLRRGAEEFVRVRIERMEVPVWEGEGRG